MSFTAYFDMYAFTLTITGLPSTTAELDCPPWVLATSTVFPLLLGCRESGRMMTISLSLISTFIAILSLWFGSFNEADYPRSFSLARLGLTWLGLAIARLSCWP